MFGKDLLIKKYPFMGFSPNIMEYFSIIGYQENFIPTLIDSIKKKKNRYYPTVLSSIISREDFGIVDNELIISQIYPDTPQIIQINKNDINQEIPSTSNVIYSFCIDSTDGKSKLFYTCFGYKFCEKYQYKVDNNIEEYYLPKAFCIVSQYNFFSFFEYVCKNIHILMTKREGLSLPVELLLYNIVNFVPSPMSYNLNLDLFSFCMKTKDVEINQLSGYPYIDFDLKEIFNFLPLNFFMEVYLLTLIEQSALFFSANLELLNMVMYIMYILNYPCNDSIYFWHIVSVSKNNLVEENKFVGKVMVSLLGVNATYDDSLDTSCFGRYHYVIDIDNKKIFLKESLDLSMDEKEEVDNLNNLHMYFQNIIKEKNVESNFLRFFILKLKKNLDNVLLKELEHNSNQKKNFNIFKTSKSINLVNKKIQEIFYDFNLNILMIFYQDNALVNSFDKIKKVDYNFDKQIQKILNLKLSENNTKLSIEEQNFIHFFRGTVKYKIYFENFIQNFETIDVFKIALLFSEEFLNIKIKDIKTKSLSKLSLFKIIDCLYYPSKKQTINITISNLLSLSGEFLKKYFENDLNNDNKLINLNKKTINKYIYLLNNNYEKEEMMDLFPSIRIQEEPTIISFDKRYIINIIQNSFDEYKLIPTKNYIFFAAIYIFCISLSLHSYDKLLKYIENITNTLSQIKLFMRQFIYIIIQTFYKYLLINRAQNGIYSEMGISQVKMYFYLLTSFLKLNNIIPNEEMMSILTKFFGQMIYQERNNQQKKSEIDIDTDINFVKKENENFFCFMKYCFNNKKYFSSHLMIKNALKENNYCNIVIKFNKKILKPVIVVKIKEYIYTTDFFSPKKIYKNAEIAYKDFYEKNNLDFGKINIKDIRDCITNLIIYGQQMNDVPNELLINTLYLLRNYEDKYNNDNININVEINNNNNIFNNEDNININNNDDNIEINNIIDENNNKDNNDMETNNEEILEENNITNTMNENKEKGKKGIENKENEGNENKDENKIQEIENKENENKESGNKENENKAENKIQKNVIENKQNEDDENENKDENIIQEKENDNREENKENENIIKEEKNEE